ncbi:hypothetical protein B0T14DRAFT_570536 [Immersiella caudata]|uniref:Uncharacterized protein n=1 Tax=Immersiella caudata TaxID=314043 RepID=A0AA40BUZ9_9PEZI|nr:hypothetical protein B0T14DRAFT_570536 [Immersiella caudata]
MARGRKFTRLNWTAPYQTGKTSTNPADTIPIPTVKADRTNLQVAEKIPYASYSAAATAPKPKSKLPPKRTPAAEQTEDIEEIEWETHLLGEDEDEPKPEPKPKEVRERSYKPKYWTAVVTDKDGFQYKCKRISSPLMAGRPGIRWRRLRRPKIAPDPAAAASKNFYRAQQFALGSLERYGATSLGVELLEW